MLGENRRVSHTLIVRASCSKNELPPLPSSSSLSPYSSSSSFLFFFLSIIIFSFFARFFFFFFIIIFFSCSISTTRCSNTSSLAPLYVATRWGR